MTEPPQKKVKLWKYDLQEWQLPYEEAVVLEAKLRMLPRLPARCAANCDLRDELYQTGEVSCRHLWHKQCLLQSWYQYKVLGSYGTCGVELKMDASVVPLEWCPHCPHHKWTTSVTKYEHPLANDLLKGNFVDPTMLNFLAPYFSTGEILDAGLNRSHLLFLRNDVPFSWPPPTIPYKNDRRHLMDTNEGSLWVSSGVMPDGDHDYFYQPWVSPFWRMLRPEERTWIPLKYWKLRGPAYYRKNYEFYGPPMLSHGSQDDKEDTPCHSSWCPASIAALLFETEQEVKAQPHLLPPLWDLVWEYVHNETQP